MKPTLSIAASLSLLALAALAVTRGAPAALALAQDGSRGTEEPDTETARSTEPQSEGGLVRVEPEEDEASEPIGPLERDELAAALRAPDLNAREENFAAIVEKARANRVLRAWLQEVAQDSGDPELAWTARLALRELRRTPTPTASPAGRPLAGPFDILPESPFEALRSGPPFRGLGDLHAEIERMEQLFESLTERLGEAGVPSAKVGRSGERVSIESGPDGVRVVIVETEDGAEDRREYQAESLEALLEAQPELSGVVRALQLDPGRSFRLHFGPQIEELRQLQRAPQPVRTDVLGVIARPVDAATATRLDLEEGVGLMVQNTPPGTIAHLLGISRGDVLVELNGRTLRERDDISAVMDERVATEELTVVWVDAWGRERTRHWRPESTTPAEPEPLRKVEGDSDR